MSYCVYMMASLSHGAIYTGMTADLAARVQAHKLKLVDGFTKKYNCIKLVYYFPAPDRDAALTKEKQIKGWSRLKKVAIIETMNPHWKDLSEEIGLHDVCEVPPGVGMVHARLSDDR